ncbi:LysM repeat protein [Natronobacillus azotifigens]|uniref:LysM peptidoglycan-binding domain-containing protein n=1 Tax=Natronobacillus azotifigens TaxID=472978 RepID=A0A9J6RG65_9BACI|nr:LysM peptidoglycan-binding domain-containing protein [Natronobacillus azotifigens]MCZ0704559.1 LysM peptidoglycan-binding domain-containing protein [Natronobacillus azotifigens]
MKKATKRVATAVVGTGLVFGAIGVSAASDTVTVEPGDTYWGLAQNYDNVSTNDLTEENDYDPQALPVGAEIVIPMDEDEDNDVVTHVVQPGNTLSEIAAVYDGVTVNDLENLNPDVDPESLTVGSEIVVVDYEDSDADSDEYVYHTVQPGNTFSEIASVYDGVTVNDLLEANPNVDPYAMTIGSDVAIPVR